MRINHPREFFVLSFLQSKPRSRGRFVLEGGRWLQGSAATPTLKELRNVCNHASNAGSGGPFRTSDPLLESEDGAVHLRPAQQDSHRQSGKDVGHVPGGDEVRAPTGGQQGHDPVRRHQAPGARNHRRRGAALRHAVRRSSLAGRHADQLQDGQGVDQAAEGPRANARRRHAGQAGPARNADAHPRTRKNAARAWAASRT